MEPLEADDKLKKYYSVKDVVKILDERPHTIRLWTKSFDCFAPKTKWRFRFTTEEVTILKIIQNLLRKQFLRIDRAQTELKIELEKRANRSKNI